MLLASTGTYTAKPPVAPHHHVQSVGRDMATGASIVGSIGAVSGGVAGRLMGSLFHYQLDPLAAPTEGEAGVAVKLGVTLIGAAFGGLAGAASGSAVGLLVGSLPPPGEHAPQ